MELYNVSAQLIQTELITLTFSLRINLYSSPKNYELPHIQSNRLKKKKKVKTLKYSRKRNVGNDHQKNLILEQTKKAQIQRNKDEK